MDKRMLPRQSSARVRSTLLASWLDREEQMFRRLERHIVADRIRSGFQLSEGADVDGFLKFSLSVQNRRKSRAGHSLELHLDTIFRAHNIAFSHGQITENRNRPDFLFPGQAEYLDPDFPESRLTMLGAKSTLKDRWRQVLSEAQRIQCKHLMTLEPAISRNQTDEMRAKNLRLVVPAKLHQSYHPEQRTWLLRLVDFVTVVQERQALPRA